MQTQHPDTQRLFSRDVSTSYNFLAATDWSGASRSTKIAGVAWQQIVVQKILLSVTTDNAATQSWQTSNATPVIVATSKASPGLGPIEWDFGPDGWVLPDGESLVHEMSGAGMAGAVTILAYRRYTPDTGLTVPSRGSGF